MRSSWPGSWIRIVLALPFLVVLVSFVLSNPNTVVIRLWPTDLAQSMPLSIAILSGMAVAFLLGAVMIWFNAIAARYAARQANLRVAALEAQVRAQEARAPATVILPAPS
ncbi:MAG: LapA family protein [Acetobacteraceae bacterium]|nr:LapA family protein [Acetobacteraceae bacterium]